MSAKKQNYGNESITSLKGADRVRLRPAVIFGSDGAEGCEHSFFEILSNSIDEAREGHGDKIIVTRFSDGSLSVEDFGRGVPVDYNTKEERYNWELVYCELYAGGKYNNISGENYEYSLGLNGLGACATQYSSQYMDVEVLRDGKKYSLHFEKGENVGGLKSEEWAKKQTGTKTVWKPDRDVFTDINIPKEYFEDILKKQAVVNSGLRFIFKNQTGSSFETEEFFYQNGVEDYIKETADDKNFTSVQSFSCERRGKDREDKPEYKVKMHFVFCFSNSNNTLQYYHNSSFLEHGGSPDKAVKLAFVAGIDAYLKSIGKYNKNESKITFGDIAESLILISNSFSTQTSYENQTKKAINNKFIAESMTEFLKHSLEVYFIENKLEADKIAEQILINKRARERAETTRINVKGSLTGKIDISSRIQKFVDCRSKKIEDRELFIVEGDSALGACKQARNAEFQAIIPVRGKILNCLKADLDKIFKNEIIIDLLKVLGCGVEIKTKNKDVNAFDLSKLRWSKVIICTDADVDGFQIRTLILAMLYRLVPSLIEHRKVYIAETPLYEIQTKKKTYFAFDDNEKADILSKIKDEKFTILRSKGLGENEPEMLSLTTMNPDSRRLVAITPEEAKATEEMFDLMLGDNLQGRKDFIAEYGSQYVELADLS